MKATIGRCIARPTPAATLRSSRCFSRILYWNSLLEACREQGFLVKTTRSDTLTQSLMYTYTGAVQHWIEKTIGTRQLYAEINYVLMILFLSHATPKGRDRIQAHAAMGGVPPRLTALDAIGVAS